MFITLLMALLSPIMSIKSLEPINMEITAYTANYESTGKFPDDPLYKITASGKEAVKGVTIAASKEIPFGTMVYIPAFADWNNNGVFIVQDRGGAITEGHIDVYFGDDEQALIDALEFGRQDLQVYILGE